MMKMKFVGVALACAALAAGGVRCPVDTTQCDGNAAIACLGDCTWRRYLAICVHEHMHVSRWAAEGVGFASKYLGSSSARAKYEAEAYRSEWKLGWWRSKQIIAAEDLADHLTGYGCTAADIASAAEIIRASEETIRRGGLVNPPTRIAIDWLAAHAPELQS
jgi:hypothetical protein